MDPSSLALLPLFSARAADNIGAFCSVLRKLFGAGYTRGALPRAGEFGLESP